MRIIEAVSVLKDQFSGISILIVFGILDSIVRALFGSGRSTGSSRGDDES